MSADDSQSTTSKDNNAPASQNNSKKGNNSDKTTTSPPASTTFGGASLATTTPVYSGTSIGASTTNVIETSGISNDPSGSSSSSTATATPAADTSSSLPPPPSAQSQASAGHQTSQSGTVTGVPRYHASSSVAAGAHKGTSPDMPYTTAQLAGAIVGSIIGASLVTFLVTFVFFGKRKQQRNSSPHRRGDGTASTRRRTSKGHASVGEKPSSRSDTLDWQAYLPQSADDRSIQNAVKTLFDQIELHVDNYYRKANVEPDDHTCQVLSQLDTHGLPGPIVNLMQDPRVALQVIKHCIAATLIARMSPGLSPAGSLLPAYLAAAPSKVETLPTPSGEGLATRQAYSQWKRLNAFLNPEPDKNMSYLRRLDDAANWIARQLSAAFGPWQVSSEGDAAGQHEKSLVRTAGTVGVLIMSQASGYEFRWDSSSDTHRSASNRSFVALPGLWKIVDENGRDIERPHMLISPVVARL